MIRQRVYRIAAGYEHCNDADHLRIDPALGLAIGKNHDSGAGQSMLSRLENGFLGNASGLASLDEALLRSSDVILWNQRVEFVWRAGCRIIPDINSPTIRNRFSLYPERLNIGAYYPIKLTASPPTIAINICSKCIQNENFIRRLFSV